jgi:VanZ family protein
MNMSRDRLFLLAFCLAAVFAFTMAELPKPPPIPGHPQDKIQHIVAFVVLTVLAIPAFPRARPIHILLSLSAFGGLIEIVQLIPALHRDSDWLDWLADTAAILGALGVTLLLRRLLFRQA